VAAGAVVDEGAGRADAEPAAADGALAVAGQVVLGAIVVVIDLAVAIAFQVTV
jgi:hypothetical protein